LNNSYSRLAEDDSEEHPQEIKELLDNHYSQFIELIKSLFEKRLLITIQSIELEENDENLEFTIKRLYEFFILNAKRNFKSVISLDIMSNLKPVYDNDDEFFGDINHMMDNYSPLVTAITPQKFMEYCGDKEISNLFESNQAVGNFLRKYTPKLYQNDDFLVEIINRITMLHQFKQDIIDNDPDKNIKEI
jgi:hypothetical protein